MEHHESGGAEDPRAVEGAEVRQPPATLLLALRKIGPGLILAAAIVGTGELIATTHTGAKAGFSLLWLVVISCFIKVFVQVELGRFAVSTGRTTFDGFRALRGVGLPLVAWCAVMLLVTQLQIGAMIAGIGQSAHLVMPGVSEGIAGGIARLGLGDSTLGRLADTRPELPWAVLAVASTAGLLATGSYRLIERTMMIFVVGFTATTVLCVALLPDEVAIRWSDVASGLVPRIPSDRTVVLAALAMFGITGVGATELLSYPYWCLEKGYARSVGPREESPKWAERARGWLRVMQLDAWVSMVIYTIATLAFYLLGAAVLYRRTGGGGLPEGVAPLIETLVQMYEPALGPTAARWFLVGGAIVVLYSTLFAATAGTGRLLADFLRVNGYFPAEPDRYRRRWVRFFCVALPVLGLGLYLTLGEPVTMVAIGGLMQALTLPLIAGAAVFLRYRRSDPRLAPGKVWDVLLILSMLGLILAGGYLASDRLGLI